MRYLCCCQIRNYFQIVRCSYLQVLLFATHSSVFVWIQVALTIELTKIASCCLHSLVLFIGNAGIRFALGIARCCFADLLNGCQEGILSISLMFVSLIKRSLISWATCSFELNELNSFDIECINLLIMLYRLSVSTLCKTQL